MIRVLHVVNSLNMGGTESVLLNLYRKIDREAIQFDFAVHTKVEGLLEHEVRKLGGNIVRLDKYRGVNIGSYVRQWEQLLDSHPEWQVVHGHMGSSAPIYLGISRKRGRYAIAHSHGTNNPNRTIRDIVWNLASYPVRWAADGYMACSREAGLDRFGRRIVESDRFTIMKNAIDVNAFQYDSNRRMQIRRELSISDGCFVVGHVGRFAPQKNHHFLLEVFRLVLNSNPNSMLLLLGKGPLEQDIRSLASEMGISEHVQFAGVRQNVNDYYQAMDAFCFPSYWEGLGMVAVEAQSSGLSCITSDAIPPIADIGAGLLHRMSLKEDGDRWANALLAASEVSRPVDSFSYARRAGYDTEDVAAWLADYYQTACGKLR